MDLIARLKQFEPIDIKDEPDPINTAFVDQFLKAITRVAKAQMKTQQSVAMTAEEVRQYLGKQEEFIGEIKSQRDAARAKNEVLVRSVLEVVDLIVQFHRTAQASANLEMVSVARTMYQALERQMEKASLSRIPALGDVPDALYHFVLDVKVVRHPSERDRIVEVVREGYMWDGVVIRKADVLVGR